MRKAIVIAGVALVSVAFGAGLGSSSVLTSATDRTVPASVTEDAWDGFMRVADEGDTERDCPHREDVDRNFPTTEETST